MKVYQRGDIIFMEMPTSPESHVQGGMRPWVVVQNNIGNRHSPTTIVCPLTTKLKRLEMPTHVPIAWDSLEISMVMCEQVRVVDVTPDWKYVCTLPKEIMHHIDRALSAAFFFEGGGGTYEDIDEGRS